MEHDPENIESQRKWLLSLLKDSLTDFYENGDAEALLTKKDDSCVSEQACAFRIGYYMQCRLNKGVKSKCFNRIFNISEGTSGIVVDAEYNKHAQYGKEVYSVCKSCANGNCFINTCQNQFNIKIKSIDGNKKIIEKKESLLSEYTKDTTVKKMRPDLLVHSRRNDNYNLMAIEIKKNLHNSDQIERYGKDFGKLTYLTCPYSNQARTKYEYVIGVFLELSASRSNSKELEFIEGQIEGQKDRLTSEGKIEKLPDLF